MIASEARLQVYPTKLILGVMQDHGWTYFNMIAHIVLGDGGSIRTPAAERAMKDDEAPVVSEMQLQ